MNAEDRDHDDRRGHHDAGAVPVAGNDRFALARHAVDVLLAHSADQEDLVVHREAEHHADQEDRQERQDRLRVGDEPSAPSWKIRTVTPNVASTEKMKPTVPISGTHSDRETPIMMRNANPTTTARYGIRALDSFSDRSDRIAV